MSHHRKASLLRRRYRHKVKCAPIADCEDDLDDDLTSNSGVDSVKSVETSTQIPAQVVDADRTPQIVTSAQSASNSFARLIEAEAEEDRELHESAQVSIMEIVARMKKNGLLQESTQLSRRPSAIASKMAIRSTGSELIGMMRPTGGRRPPPKPPNEAQENSLKLPPNHPKDHSASWTDSRATTSSVVTENDEDDDSCSVTTDRSSSMQQQPKEEKTPEEKRLHKLTKAAEELMSTEATYVQELTKLTVYLPDHLRTAVDLTDPAFAVVNRIVRLFEQILPTHQFLHSSLKAAMAAWDATNPHLVHVLIEFAPFIKTCAPFLKDKKTMVDQFCALRKANAIFDVYCAKFEAATLNGLRIEQQLDIVHQRVMRYALMLKEYNERLPLDCDEKRRTTEAIEKLEQISMTLNDCLSMGSEQQKSVMDLHVRLRKDREFADYALQPGRTLIRVGQLLKHSPREHVDPVRRTVVLFNDSILYCHNQPLGDTLKVVRVFLMDDKHLDVSLDKRGELDPDYANRILLRSTRSAIRLEAE